MNTNSIAAFLLALSLFGARTAVAQTPPPAPRPTDAGTPPPADAGTPPASVGDMSQAPAPPGAPAVEAPPALPPPAPAPAPEPPPPAPPPPAPPPQEPEPRAEGHSTGTIEVRLQTATNLSSNQFSFVTAPGFAYATESESFILNVIGGAGYFVSPTIAIGGDVGFTRIDVAGADATIIGLAPYFKFVTGMEENTAGLFVEASPGILLVEGTGSGEATLLQLAAWVGGHVPLGRSAAFLGGLSLARIDETDNFGDGEFLIGLRFGLSVYVP